MLKRLRMLIRRIHLLLHRRQLEQDLRDELEFHVAMRGENFQQAGVADAETSARRRFGNVSRIREDCRGVWTFVALERFWADVRISTRLIVKNRWVMLTIVLSLALGIGSTASVFNLFDSLLFRPLQVPDSNRVVQIATTTRSGSFGILISNPDFEDLRRRSLSFETLASYSPGQLPHIAAKPGSPPRIAFAVLVSGDFFQGLGFKTMLGRGFLPEEDQVPGRDAVAVISSGLWTREYGSSPDVLGRSLWVNSRPFTIVGVASSSVDELNAYGKPEVYLPRMMEAFFGNEATLTDRTSRRLQLFARLKDGVDIAQARDEIGRIGSQLEQEYPSTNRGQRLTVYTQLGFKMANTPEAFVAAGLFFIVVGLVLAVACVNVANLLFSTAPARTREMAIRLTMGAGRGRLTRQMLIESILISVVGTVAGLAIATISSLFFNSIEFFANPAFRLHLEVDRRVGLFALVVGVAAGFLSGLIPAVRCSRNDLSRVLSTMDTHAQRLERMPIRQALVVLQVTVAVIVLVVCGFSLQQLHIMQTMDPGFRVESVLRTPFLSVVQSEKSYRQPLERLRALPGVRAAAAAYPEPLGIGNEATNLTVDGFTMPADLPASVAIATAVVTDGYFETLGIPIVRGRSFDLGDTEQNTQAIIINEAMAEKYWPNRDALGGRIRTVGASLANSNSVTLEVVGIARTTKYHSLSEAPTPFLYLPMKDVSLQIATLFAFTDSSPASFTATLRREFPALDSYPRLFEVETMSQHVRYGALVGQRLAAQVMSAVSVIGLALSVVGLYGIVSYSVSQRTHELGIRMAVGATSSGILRLALSQGVRLSIIGVVFGITIAIVVSSLLNVFLGPANSSISNFTTLLVYAAVVALSLSVTALACYLPARRASMIDPNIALRCE